MQYLIYVILLFCSGSIGAKQNDKFITIAGYVYAENEQALSDVFISFIDPKVSTNVMGKFVINAPIADVYPWLLSKSGYYQAVQTFSYSALTAQGIKLTIREDNRLADSKTIV